MNCAYCKEDLAPTGDLACSRCGTVVHEECADLDGDCPTLGCGRSDLRPYRPPRSRRLEPSLTEYHLRREVRGWLDLLLAPREEVSLLVLGAIGLAGLALLA